MSGDSAGRAELRAVAGRSERWPLVRARLAALTRKPGLQLADAAQALDEYHALARDLAIARRVAPASRLRADLEADYAALHVDLHRPAHHLGDALDALLRDAVPRAAARLRRHIAWVSALFVLAALAGWWLVRTHPGLASLFLSSGMIATLERGELWTDGALNVAPASVLSVQILSNNIVVSLFAFVLGAFFALGTLYIVGLNGMLLGAMLAATAQYGLASGLVKFIVAHGPVELACLCLSGAAGAAIGEALARPALATRRESAVAAVRATAPLMVAVVLLLLGCGAIEAWVSADTALGWAPRLVIGAGYFALMCLLLRGVGRGRAGRTRS
jgi:uncharacterized membrane protein SpoIIM required for sporulation